LDNEALEQMKSRMELSDDFDDLKYQLNKHEDLAQSLIAFVTQGMKSGTHKTKAGSG